MQRTITAMLAILAGMAMCLAVTGCWEDDDDVAAPRRPVNLAGKVAKGYVSFALVIADKIVAGDHNYVLDDGEVSTYTDANGDFDLTVPGGYGNYVLVSLGGTIKDSNGNDVPAPPLLAPAGSKNITPLTTLVSLNPALRNQIENQTGEDFDVDLADPAGINSDAMELAQAVRTVLDILTDPNAPVVSDPEDLMLIVEHLATSLDGQDLVDDTTVSDAIENGLTNALNDPAIIDPNQVVITSVANVVGAVGGAVDGVLGAIAEGQDNVPEDNLLTTIENQVGTAVGTTATNTQSVSLEVDQVQLLDENDQLVPTIGQQFPYVYTEANADTITQLQATLIVDNEFAEDKQYNDASLVVTITDAASLRRVTMRVTNVDVTVTAADAVTIATSTQTRLKIYGINAQGEVVSADIGNTSVAGDDEIIDANGAIVTVNLDLVQAKIQNTVGAGADLFEIGLTGDYAVHVYAEGLPLTDFNLAIEVQ